MTDLPREQIEELLDGTTPGPWSGHNMIHAGEDRQMTPEELGEYVCNAAKMGSPDRFLFVSGRHDDGGDVCHTGNGPRGPANTALIAAAPDLARQLLATMTALAEAQAAQAGVVERAADRLNDLTFWTGDDDRGTTLVALQEARTAIRDLADPTGVKLLAALRAERDRMNQWRETAIVERDTYSQERDEALAQLAEAQKWEVGLCEALTEAVEIVHKSYVAATMEAVNAGPSHPIKDKYDAWRVRCMNAETKARAALSAAPTGEESNG